MPLILSVIIFHFSSDEHLSIIINYDQDYDIPLARIALGESLFPHEVPLKDTSQSLGQLRDNYK
jgi:hypothetical protein